MAKKYRDPARERMWRELVSGYRPPANRVRLLPHRGHRPAPIDFSRRNLGQNQHDAALGLGLQRPAYRRICSVRPLDDDDVPGRDAKHGGCSRRSWSMGAINGDIFRAYVQQHLAPHLKSGDIVVMDNLPSHKVAVVADAIRSVGAVLVYLPPYCPDLNPIEKVFSKVKHTIRMRAPRTNEECDRLCGESLDWFPASECFNYIRHAGYVKQ